MYILDNFISYLKELKEVILMLQGAIALSKVWVSILSWVTSQRTTVVCHMPNVLFSLFPKIIFYRYKYQLVSVIVEIRLPCVGCKFEQGVHHSSV